MQRLLFLVIGTFLRQVQSLIRLDIMSPHTAAALIEKVGVPAIVERQRVVHQKQRDKNNRPYPNL
ncbi:MAG: hypothetical protein AAFP19_00285 [Bacteroidota bacterium]